jgi:prepilin-type N-terminal cleavage/methylation domain-containing protein
MKRQAKESKTDWAGGGRHLSPARAGFTLVELMAVIVIISIILALILTASMDGIRRAEERATQALITKLEAGLNDRLEALMQTLPTPNYAHAYLAGVYPGGATEADGGPLMLPQAIQTKGTVGMPNPKCLTLQRAQVIATFDFIKSEMPDVFFVQNDPNYPLNFTGLPFPGTPFNPPAGFSGAGHYILPLGHMITGPRIATGLGFWPSGYGDAHADPSTFYLVSTHPELGYTGTGIFGASYTAAAGLYKNIKAGGISYLPVGYDGIDNDNDGLVDNIGEGIPNATDRANFMTALRTSHKHSTARAEMLYALLVEGGGPLGSVFSRDDFTDKEVKDTDGDGMPEFVDAWGQPLQFFRWPLLYRSDIQRGQAYAPPTVPSPGVYWALSAPYGGVLDQREQDPLDPNQQLVAPAWFLSSTTGGLAANPASPFTISPAVAIPPGGPPTVGPAVQFFGTFFHRLTEPVVFGSATDWDRSGLTRRAFFTKFLVLSGGLDGTPGVFQYGDADLASFPTPDAASAHIIANENNAMPFGWTAGAPDVDFISNSVIAGSPPTISYNPSADPTHPTSFDLFQAAQDDLTNQNLQSTGGVGGSG